MKPIKPPKAKAAVKEVVAATLICKISPPKGSSKTSSIMKAMVPKPTTTKRRRVCGPLQKWAQALEKESLTGTPGLRNRLRGSCFHKASTFKTRVSKATVWVTRIKRPGLYSLSKSPNSSALKIMPANCITNIKPTTWGWVSGGAKSVAKAKPTVWVVCMPTPTIKKAPAAPTRPTHVGAWLAWPAPASTNRANGMTANPPNWIRVPIHKKGTRRHPNSERWLSDLKPIKARKGAASKGMATIKDTKLTGT